MDRYDAPVSLLTDEAPTEADLAAFVLVLREKPELAGCLAEDLVTEEAWSRASAPERSAASFLTS